MNGARFELGEGFRVWGFRISELNSSGMECIVFKSTVMKQAMLSRAGFCSHFAMNWQPSFACCWADGAVLTILSVILLALILCMVASCTPFWVGWALACEFDDI